MYQKLCKTILLAAVICCAGTLAAQGMPSLFGKDRLNNKNRSADIPTVVTAMTMDIDMGRNLATLLGDVLVDDQDMSIRCEKMLIHFEDKPKDENKDGKDGDGKKDEKKDDSQDEKKDGKDNEKEKSPVGNKQPTRIECFGDVVIQAKPRDKDGAEKTVKDQKATAGKAVYDLKKDEITLTENPVINDGSSKVTGTKIIIVVNEERMIVLRASASTNEALRQ